MLRLRRIWLRKANRSAGWGPPVKRGPHLVPCHEPSRRDPRPPRPVPASSPPPRGLAPPQLIHCPPQPPRPLLIRPSPRPHPWGLARPLQAPSRNQWEAHRRSPDPRRKRRRTARVIAMSGAPSLVLRPRPWPGRCPLPTSRPRAPPDQTRVTFSVRHRLRRGSPRRGKAHGSPWCSPHRSQCPQSRAPRSREGWLLWVRPSRGAPLPPPRAHRSRTTTFQVPRESKARWWLRNCMAPPQQSRSMLANGAACRTGRWGLRGPPPPQ